MNEPKNDPANIYPRRRRLRRVPLSPPQLTSFELSLEAHPSLTSLACAPEYSFKHKFVLGFIKNSDRSLHKIAYSPFSLNLARRMGALVLFASSFAKVVNTLDADVGIMVSGNISLCLLLPLLNDDQPDGENTRRRRSERARESLRSRRDHHLRVGFGKIRISHKKCRKRQSFSREREKTNTRARIKCRRRLCSASKWWLLLRLGGLLVLLPATKSNPSSGVVVAWCVQMD